jgi:CRISPR/Cas system-associated endonuclease/helicase Cas3
VKKELGLEEDDIIDIYQSLVKHEICLMRLGDICTTESDGGYYVAKHGFSVRHNVDAQMTIVDVLYAMLVESDVLLNKFGLNDVDGFVDKIRKLIDILVERRLLIDMPCADKRVLGRLDDVLSGKSVIELNDVDNVYMYFDMLDNTLGDKLFDRFKKVIQKEWLYSQYVEKIRKLIWDWKRKGVCFKTAYGELIKLLRYEAPLPFTKGFETSLRRVLEAYVLPFLEEPLPEYNRSLDDDNDDNNFKKSVTQKLGDRYSNEINVIIGALKSIGIERLHEYQFVMLDKMFSLFDRPKIVVISAPTASGKTEIFMTYLAFKLLMDNDGAAVIIYPTKALARQQLQRFIGFMYNINRKINNKTIHVYILDGDSPSGEVKGQPFRGGIEIELRSENREGYLEYNNEGKLVIKWNDGQEEDIEWVHERKEVEELKKPAIVITNDSMLSKHIREGSRWVIDLAASLNTIVIDEAHVFMNDKKRSDFVHFLLLRLLLIALLKKIGGGFSDNVYLYKDFKELIRERKFDIILSSATMSDREVLKQGMSTRQLGGIDLAKVTKAAGDSSGSSAPPYELLLRGWIKRAYEESDQGEKSIIFESYYDKIGNSKRRRLYVTVVYFPEPMGASKTPFIEALATTTIWTAAVGKGLGHRLHAIAFMDSKETVGETFKEFIRPSLSKECFHADKLLVSPLLRQTKQDVCPDNIGHKYIERLLTYLNQKQDTGGSYQLFARYSHLQFYYKWNDVESYIRYMQKLLNSQQGRQSPDIVKEAENFARDVYEAASRYGSTSSKGSRYWICKPKDGSGECEEYYVLQHHADLERTLRQEIEKILSSKDNWNLVIATSTLELGVNIPGVAVVLQYGAPPSGESFVQRVGRSGRDEWSFRTAFGAVFARNVGKDIMLIDEMEAIKNLYNLTRPGYSPELDSETLARYMALIYFDGAIIDTIGAKHSIDDPLVQALFQALLKLYLDDKKINEILDNIKKIAENRERYEQILSSEEINKPRGIIPTASLIVNEESSNNGVIVENLMIIEVRLKDVERKLKKEIRPGQEYVKELEEKVEEVKRLQEDVYSLRESIERPFANRGRLSISTYLHEYATYIYDKLREVDRTFEKIVDDINKIINVNKSSDLEKSLKTAMNAIKETEQMILSTIIASDEICLSSQLNKDRHTTSYDDTMALLLGMPMPHPVSYSEPGHGCSLVFDEVEISDGKYGKIIKLKREKKEGETPRNANRDYVLRNVPFKHHEVS